MFAVRKKGFKDLRLELDQTVQFSVVLHDVVQRARSMTVNVEDVFLVTAQSSRFSGSCNLVGFVKVSVLRCFVDLSEERLEHLLVRLDAELVFAFHHGPFFVTEKPAL